MKCIKKLLCSIFGWFCPENPPDPPQPPDPPPDPPDPPDPPPPPPPSQIKVDVCTRSGKKATNNCKKIGCVESRSFPAGGGPQEFCFLHDIGVLETPRKYARSGIWDWLAVIQAGWKKEDEVYALEQWFFKCREIFKTGVQSMAGFITVEVGDGEHQHFFKKGPFLWLTDKNKYQLAEKSPRYWELATKMMEIVKLFSEPGKPRYFQPCLTMFKYNERLYNLNVNGVAGLKTQEAIPFVENLLRWWIEMTRSVFGQNYKPPWKAANEFAHPGHVMWDGQNIHEFTFNSRFHRRLTDTAVFEYGIPIWKETVDTSHSEGCSAGVNEWKFADKDGLWHGYKPSELVINRMVPTKCVLMEKHGCGSVASWKEYSGYHENPNFFVSGNKEMAFSVDGGTGFIRDGKGYIIGGPDGFYWPDHEQWRESVRTAAELAASKNKRIIFEWAAPEVFMKFVNGKRVFDKYVENPDYKLLDYTFQKIMIEEIDRAYGAP